MFAVAVSCLAQAHIQPTALDLRFRSTGAFGWNSLPGWAQLDLSKVEKLSFQPVAQCLDEWGSWSHEREEEVGARACSALNDVLRKCSGSLKDLFIKRESPLTWPTADLVPLPELKRIELDGIHVNNGNFARLLQLMPKLTYYALICTSGTQEWKAMLDAVRNHGNRMDVHWDQIASNDCAEISLYDNTANVSEDRENEDPWMDIDRSLQNYLAGKGGWNKCLRMWFEDES